MTVALPQTPRPLATYRKHWAHKLGTAPFLPTSQAELDELGWDQCDVILVTGDAYVDHPSFGMALVGRLLESQGFRVGILAQPFVPTAAAKLLDLLSVAPEGRVLASVGPEHRLAAGTALPQPAPIFPRYIEAEA